MNHFKTLNSFLFLTYTFNTFSVLIDTFTEPSSGYGELTSNETELGTLTPPISASRTLTVGIDFNSDTGNLRYKYGSAASLTYNLTPTLDMINMPIVRLNFAATPSATAGNNFKNLVTLTDNVGAYIQTEMSIITNDQQAFDFTDLFNSIKYPGYGQFNYDQVKKIDINLNTEGGVGPAYNSVSFEIESVEAIPEPFTLATLGTGFAVFVRKKRLKKE